MKREFCYTYGVRYDECNCDGVLTPAAFLRYMQDIAARDAEDVQLVGNGYWVVKRTVVSFMAPVAVHTQLKLRTYGIGFTRITAQRGYEASIEDEERDDPVISARTLWVYVDPHGRPARLPEGTAAIWLPDGPLPQQAEALLPIMSEGTPEIVPSVVRFSQVDLARHMNNASAVEMLDNAAWEGYAKGGITPDTARFDICEYDIEYLESPRFGEQLEIESWLDPFPAAGLEYTRFQQIRRGGRVVVKARSRWLGRG